MKFTYNWLQEYAPLDGVSPARLADQLTMLGLEVDSVAPLFSELADLKTGKVLASGPHPNADKLSLCRVAVGEQELQIVCGAPNVRAGLTVVVALPGTTLPGDVKIKKSKVRGIESQGMICSERELGLGDDHSGIMELADDIPSGASFLKHSGLQDTLIEVDLTPNRPDCASVIGIAREAAGINRRQLQVPYRDSRLEGTSSSFSVTVEAPELCPRYAGRLITGVTIGPSPWWLKRRLLAIGQRPVNNVVDVTNLVMLEYGQPLHAFDFNKLAGRQIVVRTPRNAETSFTALDHVKRDLTPDMLLICDGESPVGIAGIMGGLDSEVSESTTDVLLESAYFNPVSIRKTARRLGLATDASYRFERGVDPDGTIAAMERAVSLICQVAGGTAEPGGIDVDNREPGPGPLTLRVSRTAELLGIELDARQIVELLTSIEIGCTIIDDDTISVTPPSFRVDLEREADLVEEVARLTGYDEIPVTLPSVDLSYPEQDHERLERFRASTVMNEAGFYEAINYSFVSSSYDDKLRLAPDDSRRHHVTILNPLTEDQDVMRTSLLPGLLENIKRNLRFEQTAARLFEIGKLYVPAPGNPLPHEPTQIAGLLVGNRHGGQTPLYFPSQDVDIYDAKGGVEALLAGLRLPLDGENAIELVPEDSESVEPFAEPAYALVVRHGDRRLGTVGRIRADVLRDIGIKREVYYFDLDFSALCTIEPQTRSFRALPIYPSVKRDIALVVPITTPAGELVKTVLSSREKLVEQCDVFDVYQGSKIGDGRKSVALTITYRSDTKTLTEKQVEKAHARLVQSLTDTFGGSLREE
jgi:phenylalanyl-tRNA synthetase beta chain